MIFKLQLVTTTTLITDGRDVDDNDISCSNSNSIRKLTATVK